MRRLRDFLLPAPSVPEIVWQNVYISNILSFILFFISLGFLGAYTTFFGWGKTSYVIILGALSFLSAFRLLKTGYYNFGRVLFCLLPVIVSLFATVFSKHESFTKTWLTFFDSRFVLLGCMIIPGIVFRLSERNKLIPCLAVNVLALIFFDPIHNASGVGFYQLGFTTPGYYYINYIVFLSAVFLLLGITFLKSISEQAQIKREEMNQRLKEQNNKLIFLNNEMEAQNEELHQQQEEISAGRDMLAHANKLISSQQNVLMEYNVKLEEMVAEKNSDLLKANSELIKHNNELRQFSYTVSHNLRGPVARLLGLTNLLTSIKNEKERIQILELLHQSTLDLDSVLRDLNFIIDIRNDIYRVRERVKFEEEWRKALRVLGENVKEQYLITDDFSGAPNIFGVKAMVQSIFFNLVSNSIKYRSPERNLVLHVKTYINDKQQIILEIGDNGLGIDLRTQRDQVFKLYKRFHTHVDGKGLGLYLVKTQAEALNAKVEIESELNRGAFFRFTFTTPPALDKQIFFESETAKLYYDAYLNNTVIIWKKIITSEEYRRTFDTVLMTLKTYKTPGWIADLRNQGVVGDDDQLWFIQNVLTEAIRLGLKRIGAVGLKDPVREQYYHRMKERTANFGVNLEVFDTLEEATSWMQSFMTNQK